jgi:hypothetical protein
MNEAVDSRARATLAVGTATYSSVSGTVKTLRGGLSGSENGGGYLPQMSVGAAGGLTELG